MNKYPLIGGSICAVVLLVLASLTNIVGYQTIQASNQRIINEEVNQKELLFQTIVDMANNKEIQKVILESLEGKLSIPLMKTPSVSFPALTRNKLNVWYNRGMFLSKVMSKSRMNSLFKHPIMSTETQEKINSSIHNNTELTDEITQLSALNCPCSQHEGNWTFPVICILLLCIYAPSSLILFAWLFTLDLWSYLGALISFILVIPIFIIFYVSVFIGRLFGCWWSYG